MSKSASIGTIVIAWTIREMAWDGKPYAKDLSKRPGLVAVTIPKAAVWVNRGTTKDLDKATAFAASENRQRDEGETPRVVFVYKNERKPLDRARREIVGLPR